MSRSITFMVAGLIIVGASPVYAQWAPRLGTVEPPVAEVGATVGLWNFDNWNMSGGRFTTNHKNWLATEASFDFRRVDALAPGYGVLLVNTRLLAHHPWRPASVFVTLGVARAWGLSYPVSPMIGVGAQSHWAGGLLAVRGDFQFFPAGKELRGRGRLMLGVAIALHR
jgi:hypothetical protein